MILSNISSKVTLLEPSCHRVCILLGVRFGGGSNTLGELTPQPKTAEFGDLERFEMVNFRCLKTELYGFIYQVEQLDVLW